MADGTASNGLRCRPGELAWVVIADADTWIPVGHVVKCIAYERGEVLFQRRDGRILVARGYWRIEYRGSMVNPETGNDWGISDDWLHPIRDPGPDAVDETLRRLPAPAAQPVVGLPAAPVEA